MGQRDREFVLDLSEYQPHEREAIALEVIDKIVKRAKSGVDKNGRSFAGYSEAYKKSLNFKIAGKTAKVDLTLSGDMLDSLEIIENYGNGKVKIGYAPGNSEGGKAEGNILGTYGNPSPIGPKRDFLGLPKNEIDAILSKYPPDTKKAETRALKRLLKEGESERLSGRIDVEDLIDDD